MVAAAACSKHKSSSPCDGVTCSGHGICSDSSGRAVCTCDDGYVPSGTLECAEAGSVDELCKDVQCDEWKYCSNGDCVLIPGRCDEDSDCNSPEKCNKETHYCEDPRCDGTDCGEHGRCRVASGYGSGYGYGSDYQSGDIFCECNEGFVNEDYKKDGKCVECNTSEECKDGKICSSHSCGDTPPECTRGDSDCGAGSCEGDSCRCVSGAFYKEESGKCECYDGLVFNNGMCETACTLNCGENGRCENNSCVCSDGYFNLNGDKTAECVECNTDNDCESGKTCDLESNTCSEACLNVNCGNGGVCSAENGKAVCNCPHGFVDEGLTCVEITTQHPGWIGVQWPFTINKMIGGDPDMVYGRIWVENETGCPLSTYQQHSNWIAQLGYKKGTGSTEYPIIRGSWTWIDANFNSGYDCADGNQNHEYMIPFPTDKNGDFIYIFRFSLDGGNSWWYGDKGVGPDNSDVPGPGFITSADNHPGKATIEIPPTNACTIGYSKEEDRTSDSYTFTLKYNRSASIDFAASIITLNGKTTSDYSYDEMTKTFTVSQSGLEPNKYSWLFRLVDENGESADCFVPIWVGDGVNYADFGWRDAFVYQIMTDRFLNGDTSNDVPHYDKVVEIPECGSNGDKNYCDLEQWKGGDFRGIIKKIDDNYFSNMGVNAIWISTPVLNEHGTSSQSDVYFTSYHAYHPVATGNSFDKTYIADNEGVDTAFGTADELRELVEKAHKKGIRVITDFVVNHVHANAPLYQQHKTDSWFYSSDVLCGPDWSNYKIRYCWFTPYMPDFNYNNADARKEVIKHALWLIENFNLDGFRADALKHIDDIFVTDLRTAVKENIETTVTNHDMPDEAEVFYMVGESLGGKWPRYHTRADMVQGQVNEQYYYAVKNNILNNGGYSSLKDRIMNSYDEASDEAYLTEKDAEEGKKGGFPGAVMGNFFGNHDQNRALTECGSDYVRFKHAQTFLLTTPINIPMLYQGDDIGMTGTNRNVAYCPNGKTSGCNDNEKWNVSYDGGRRAVMTFNNLSNDEKDALKHVQRLGKFRNSHIAARKGTRYTCGSTNDAWVYVLKCETNDKIECKGNDTVIVGINKGSSAYTTTCDVENGTFTSYDGSSVQVSGGSVTVPAGGSLVIGK